LFTLDDARAAAGPSSGPPVEHLHHRGPAQGPAWSSRSASRSSSMHAGDEEQGRGRGGGGRGRTCTGSRWKSLRKQRHPGRRPPRLGQEVQEPWKWTSSGEHGQGRGPGRWHTGRHVGRGQLPGQMTPLEGEAPLVLGSPPGAGGRVSAPAREAAPRRIPGQPALPFRALRSAISAPWPWANAQAWRGFPPRPRPGPPGAGTPRPEDSLLQDVQGRGQVQDHHVGHGAGGPLPASTLAQHVTACSLVATATARALPP
jgi:hypothetical protein